MPHFRPSERTINSCSANRLVYNWATGFEPATSRSRTPAIPDYLHVRSTMHPQELIRLLRTQAFVPFRIHMTDGHTYDIPHPELMIVGPSARVHRLARTGKLAWLTARNTARSSHIVRVEVLTPIDSAGAAPAASA